ncbi:MAG: hypothetical protein JWM91_3290 [Rhodospirillales bacterium]|nr:hypothetical protein [Rhodospirillales bacterium]
MSFAPKIVIYARVSDANHLRGATVQKPMSRLIPTLFLMAALLSIPLHAAETPASPSNLQEGAALYGLRCAVCHDNPQLRLLTRFDIQTWAADDLARTLTVGSMREQAAGLGGDQIRSLVIYLTGTRPNIAIVPNPYSNSCKDRKGAIRLDGTQWNGWGRDLEDSRYQPQPGLNVHDVPRLDVKWAFAYPGGAYGQPVVVGDRVYITSKNGQIFSLDAQSGCTYWTYDAGVAVRTAITIGVISYSTPRKFAAYFGDENGSVHALDATTGRPLWSTQVDDHPTARILGSPKLYDRRLYVPVSSLEEVAAANPQYRCCTFRGSVVSINAMTGRLIWKTHTIQREPKPFKTNSAGTQMYGPAGAAVWSSPTIDAKRKLVYVGTGDSYTAVPTDASDAIVAFDLETGKRKWVSQVRPDDAWVFGCTANGRGNCPEPLGPDFDFGSSPILAPQPGGRQIILAAAKSGVVYAFDPDRRGTILWQAKLGEGSGSAVIWGPAADGENLYVATANPESESGLTALRITTGEQVWHTVAAPPSCDWGAANCYQAQPAALTVIPGAVFSGALDGHLRAYSTETGKIIWNFDTAKSYDAVNGGLARGGSLDGGAQTIANGVLYVTSGSHTANSPHPGNALLALTVDGE